MKNKIIKIGHRGARAYIAENTLASFKHAIELGVDAIEFDVMLCGSGELIVFHDHRVDYLSNGTGLVENLSLKYLKSLDVGGGNKIPTLEEALNFIDRNIPINIEIKGNNTVNELARILSDFIDNKGWKASDFYISSFNQQYLLKIKKQFPEIRIGVLLVGIPLYLAKIGNTLNAYSINLSLSFINKDIVDDAHKRGLKVFVYTVNNVEDIEMMKEMGVDGIFSDSPDLL